MVGQCIRHPKRHTDSVSPWNRYQPIFVLPIVASVEGASVNGRKRITGFTRVSLMQMLNATGRIPTQYSGSTGHGQPLEAILKAADRPVVLLPEATTSNNVRMGR